MFNEQEVLREFISRVRGVLARVPGGPHELLFVDDGSADATPAVLDEAAREDVGIVVLTLSRNFGHQAALTAALDHVQGDVVVVMDADLQDTPETIPSFLEEHARGADVVYARRVARKEGVLVRTCYFLFYRVILAMSDVRLPLDAGDFALLSRRVVDELRRTREQNRYLRGLRAWVGFRQVGIDVDRAARGAGRSKYGLWKLLKLATDGLFSFSVIPIRLAALLGLAAIAGALVYSVYALFAKLMLGTSPQGFTALLTVMVFLSGIQLLFLGVIGEYVGRVYEEVKHRPLYVLKERAPHRPSAIGRPDAT